MGYAQREMAELHGWAFEEDDGADAPTRGTRSAPRGSTWNVLEEVAQERARQDTKWGIQNHEPSDYFAILAEEVGEAAKEVVEFNFSSAKGLRDVHRRLELLREELVQSAAVAVAFIEALDRREDEVATP